MKRVGIITILLSSLIATTSADYSIEWYTIDGGGGRSGGGPYELIGTIGQADASTMIGGDYEVLGGFWPGGPLCFVEFEDYARFAQYWLQSGSDLAGDLYKDEFDIVDWKDLDEFVYWWLYDCPYGWPF